MHAAEPDRRRGRGQLSRRLPDLQHRTTARSSPRSSARRSRSPSTRWATSISARAATSSGTPTTRSFRRWRSCPIAEPDSAPRRRVSRQVGRMIAAPAARAAVHFLLLGRRALRRLRTSPSAAAAIAPSQPDRADARRPAPAQIASRRNGGARRRQRRCSGLVENRVQEEILYREALAMGLDKDDTIVKRRMAQKMQFLAEDVAAAREPTTEELEAWFAKNATGSRCPAASRSGTSTSRPTGAASARATTRRRRSRSSPASPWTGRARRPSPIRSCSRTTTATARRSSSPRSSARPSRRPSSSRSPARGRARSSPATAGTSCSSTR